jgi:hypothetical protein
MNSKWSDCYFEHFQKFFGQPVDGKTFKGFPDLPAIEVFAYDGVFRGCRVFCTNGLSDYRKALHQIAEVYLSADNAWETIPFLLCNTLFYIINQKMEFGWGISINGIEEINPEFAQKYKKAALYFTLPGGLPNGFEKVKCGNEEGKIYVAMFISQQEHDFFIERGAEAFEDLLKKNNVDPYELSRASVL